MGSQICRVGFQGEKCSAIGEIFQRIVPLPSPWGNGIIEFDVLELIL